MLSAATVIVCCLQEVEGQLQPLLGDSTLAALAVVYLGGLLPAQRSAALDEWQVLLVTAEVRLMTSKRTHTHTHTHTHRERERERGEKTHRRTLSPVLEPPPWQALL